MDNPMLERAQHNIDDARRRRAEAIERARKASDPKLAAESITAALEAMAETMAFASDEDIARARAEQLANERLETLQRSGIADVIDGEVAEAIARETAEQTPALRLVASWWAWASDRAHPERPRTFVLLGDIGIGKTVAAAAAIAAHGGGRYVSADELARAYVAHCRIAERGFQDRDTVDPWLAVVGTGLLVVDELTTARSADAERDALAEAVDRRRGRGKLTLLMGNATADQVKARLDARTIDRLRTGPIKRLAGTSRRPNRGGL